MPHPFEIREDITVEATPEQVWDAIATGPGINSWFMGRTEVEPREGGRVQIEMPGWSSTATVTAWEPGRHFAYQEDENPDGTFMALEYLVEGNESSTVVRFVHSGFLADDWEAEYNALTQGDRMYLEKLGVYLKHFAGRTATFTLFEVAENIPAERAWNALRAATGLGETVAVGDKARVAVDGLEPATGVVDFARLPHWVGVTTDDGFYAFMHAQDSVVVEYSGFGQVDGPAIERAWQSWLSTTFA